MPPPINVTTTISIVMGRRNAKTVIFIRVPSRPRPA